MARRKREKEELAEEEDEASTKEVLLTTVRDIAIALIIVAILIGTVFAYTQVWPPLVVIESESMQIDEFSHIGIIDTGDLVLVKKVTSLMMANWSCVVLSTGTRCTSMLIIAPELSVPTSNRLASRIFPLAGVEVKVRPEGGCDGGTCRAHSSFRLREPQSVAGLHLQQQFAPDSHLAESNNYFRRV